MRAGRRTSTTMVNTGLALLLLCVGQLSEAQDRVSGHVSAGWRGVWQSGDDAKYDQHVDLDQGARLFDFAFSYRPESGGVLWQPDRLDVQASNLGGDPYDSIRLDVQKYGAYRFTYHRQTSDYFYDDSLLSAEFPDADGDFRRFDFERDTDRAKLELDLSDRARLFLGYDRYEKSGKSLTVLDVEREEFELNKPIDETLQSFEAGLSYAWDKVNLTWTERYRDFDDDSSISLPEFSPGSEPAQPTELDFFFLDQPYQYTGWEHQLSTTIRPMDRLTLEANVIVGDLDADLKARERSQGIDFTGQPFARDISGAGDIDQDRNLYDASVGYDLNEQVSLFGRYRWHKLRQSGDSEFEQDAVSRWQVHTSIFETGAQWRPMRELTVSAGWTRENRDVDYRQANEDFDDAEDEETRLDGYYVRVAYAPLDGLDLYVSAEDNNIDDPFTLASPTDSRKYRVKGRYRWASGWGLAANYRYADYENDNSNWETDSHQADLRVTYAGSRLSVSAGYTYVDVSRSIIQLVRGDTLPFRVDRFDIDYDADSDFVDGAVTWKLSQRWTLGGSFRYYDNSGSYDVKRDDARIFAEVEVSDGYLLGLDYRYVDYKEDSFDEFDADILELSIGRRW